MRYVYKGTLANYTDMRFVSDDYVLVTGETEGRGDRLPALNMDQILARTPYRLTIDDIVSVLSPEQKAALARRIGK